MRKNIMLATAIVVVGLMITSAASSLSIQQTDLKENEIEAHFLSVQSQPIAKRTVDTSLVPLSVAITGGDFDEYHPSVAGAPTGEYYAMAEYSEDDVVWHPMLYGSTDGTVWDPLVEFLYDDSEYSDWDQNDYGTYGTFGAPPTDDGIIAVIQGEILDGWIWDFGSYNLNEFSHNTIDCYTFEGPDGDPGEWNWGGLTMSGYNGYTPGSEVEGAPFIFYQYSSDGGGVIGWLTGDIAGCENIGSAMDTVTNMHYAVYDRDTGAGNYDLLIRKDNYGVWTDSGGYWTHPMVTNLQITDTANLMYPSAAANNNNVVIACQKDADVIVYYSTNGFSSKTEVTVETGASYPEVAIAGDGTVLITYIKEGTMYFRTSDDSGATWSSAAVVSDNQVNPNDQSANLDTYNGNIDVVWEDIRGDNVDIYFEKNLFEVPNDEPFAPAITGPNGGKKETSYTFNFNAVDPNEDDVRYFIDWGDTNTETTGYVTQDTNHPVPHTYAEDGQYTITAYAQDTYGANGDTATKSFKVTRSKALDITFLKLLENHPNLFPILRQLLGL